MRSTATLIHKGGNVIIPAFTVGRTQDLLFLLIDLIVRVGLGKMDIYVDSLMARSDRNHAKTYRITRPGSFGRIAMDE